MAIDTENKVVCGIELKSDFPGRRDSPDPVVVIEALVEHGTFTDAAREIDGHRNTLQKWANKYPEVEEAYMKGRESIGNESEHTAVMIMRGQLPETAEKEHVATIKPANMLNAAKWLAGTNHTRKDYTRKNKIIRKSEETTEEFEEDLENMSQDELLDELNKRIGSDE